MQPLPLPFVGSTGLSVRTYRASNRRWISLDRSIAAYAARRLTRLFTLRQWKGANEIAIKPKLCARERAWYRERERGRRWEKERARKVGGWWSGLQQISPDDFHFLRTNYSPSPGARSFVSAAFANKSRNGCAATKSWPPATAPPPLWNVEDGHWPVTAPWKSSNDSSPFFSNISYIGVFWDFFIREKVFFSVFWEILPLLVSIEGGRGGVEREEGRLVGLLWRVISLLFTCFEDRENNNIWAYNKLFEVCYTGYIFFFFFGWMFLQILFSFSPPFFFRRVFFP